MNFPTLQITGAGKAALIKALDGQKLEFTRIAIGNGDTPDDISQLTAMQNEVISVGINAITKGENFVTLETSFDNSEVNCYYAHEIGVFARNSTDDETGSEVLYAYAYSGDTADYVPESTSQSYVKTTLNIIVAVGEAENVSAVLSEYAAYANKEAFEAHVADMSNPHNVTKEQIGLGNVENLSVSDGVPDMETSTTIELTEGDKMSTLFGKLKYAMTRLYNHLNNYKNPHAVSCSQIGAATTTHTHKATDITSGTLPITRGGTGATTANNALKSISQNRFYLSNGPHGVSTTNVEAPEGNVCITAASKIDFFADNGDYKMSICSDGEIEAYDNITIGSSDYPFDYAYLRHAVVTVSDRKKKENLVDVTTGLQILKALNFKEFNLIGDDNVIVGLVAQDVYKALKTLGIKDRSLYICHHKDNSHKRLTDDEIDSYDDSELVWSLDYQQIANYCLQGIQSYIEQSENKISELEKRLERLEGKA